MQSESTRMNFFASEIAPSSTTSQSGYGATLPSVSSPTRRSHGTANPNQCRRCGSILSHYHLISFMAFSLVVLCTSEALVPSTPFLPPRGGSTSASVAAGATTTTTTTTNSGSEGSTTTHRSLYVGDGHEDGDVVMNGASSAPSSSSQGRNRRLSLNGAKPNPNKAFHATAGTRIPPAYRNGFKKPALANGAVSVAKVTGSMKGTVTTMNGEGVINIDNGVSSPTSGAFVDQPIPAEFIAETNLPTDVGQFRLRAYRTAQPANEYAGREPAVIYAADKSPFGSEGNLREGVPVRIHDQCLTSEVFRSQRCDCSQQLKMALQFVADNGGAIIYLQQEGRGIGLANKVAAYALQDDGMDTVDANLHLGFSEDCRQYGAVPAILDDMKIGSIQLMTNNPRKLARLRSLGVEVRNTLPMVVPQTNQYNHRYLEAKHDRMNHTNLSPLFAKNGNMAPKRTLRVATDYITKGEEMAANAVQLSLTVADSNSEEAEGVSAQEDGYCFGRQSVVDAIAAVKEGKMVVVVDDMNRENEGDLIMAADACTPEDMAFIVRHSSGVVCIAMDDERMNKLKLPPMVQNNEDPKGTAFTVTVDATKEHGITTGISATDRARTVNLLANPDATATDFARPGHIFPLRAREGGVLTRDGHTEAAVDLSALAGRDRSGILCEIVSDENPVEMARLPELKRFCKKYGLVLTSIVDIAQFRRDTEHVER